MPAQGILLLKQRAGGAAGKEKCIFPVRFPAQAGLTGMKEVRNKKHGYKKHGYEKHG